MPRPGTRSSRGDRKGRARTAPDSPSACFNTLNRVEGEKRLRRAAERWHYKHHAPVQKGIGEKDWREGMFTSPLSRHAAQAEALAPPTRQKILASARTL